MVSQNCRLGLVADDGAVAYINGKEVARQNVPRKTEQGRYTGQSSGDNTYFEQVVPPLSVQPGPNVLAVAVHQVNAMSSDLSFDLSLTYTGRRNKPILKFDNLVGDGHKCLPRGSIVGDAKLTLVSADDIPAFELRHIADSGISLDISVSRVAATERRAHQFDVTDSLQEWATGEPNEGWALVFTDDRYVEKCKRGDLQAHLSVQFWSPPHQKYSTTSEHR